MIANQDAGVVEELAAGRQIVEMNHARARWQGVIGVYTEDGRVTAITATRCELARIPDSITQLAQLERLDLSGNPLRELPAGIGKLAALRELYLYDCGLVALPALDGTALEVLDLNRNPGLAQLPALARLPLAFLYLESCGLNALPALPMSLRYLNVSSNPLGALPIGELAGLEELRAEYVRLHDTPIALHRLGKLRELHLRGNGIRELPPVATALETLGLRDNNFAELPASLAGHPNLIRLDLRGNFIDTVPAAIAELPKLRKLDLRWNPLRDPLDWYTGLVRRGCQVYT